MLMHVRRKSSAFTSHTQIRSQRTEKKTLAHSLTEKRKIKYDSHAYIHARIKVWALHPDGCGKYLYIYTDTPITIYIPLYIYLHIIYKTYDEIGHHKNKGVAEP